MLYEAAQFDIYMLRSKCRRYVRLGWAIYAQSADGRSVIMHRKKPTWLSPNFLRGVLNITREGQDEYIKLSFDKRRIQVEPYHGA